MKGGVILVGLVLVLLGGMFWTLAWVGTQACLQLPTCFTVHRADFDTLQLTMTTMTVVIAAGGVVTAVGFLLKTPQRGFQPVYRAYARNR